MDFDLLTDQLMDESRHQESGGKLRFFYYWRRYYRKLPGRCWKDQRKTRHQ